MSFAAVLLVLLGVAFLLVRNRLNDGAVPRARSLLVAGAPRTVLAIWAHPDDEITSAGTLAAMARDGAQVILIYLTRGEAARDTGYGREDLARVRGLEAQAAGATLRAHAVEVFEWPDGGLSATDGEAVKGVLRKRIAQWKPSVLISFDERVGYYGHPDHVAAGRWARELAQEDNSVRRLYQATLPRALIRIALKLVAAFRNNYPTDPAAGLPAPTVAVPVARFATAKRRLLDVHASQAKVIADVQPGYDRLPAWLYYRLFDREYFTLAFSR
ncbi:MAG: PIG-L family deacetylase [Phenylobacterium sp.]|uniref:PIG-L deacetylase family protein n=1 Tax=Phenylobacterium sp. TaxID=1871053 RepID=UPI002716575C|nr:PIG-L family deacetylase [Phenylobacterium sp.]MDO8911585.1 PIG-L family deacetylase [Phenylobacterium sp.]MDP3099393.1 PIG-L family deacetylase [Phenylobacterium sp.]